jgi:hypothetical protein
MAHVKDFDCDIFISYAHVDNLEGWVDKFLQKLRIRLLQVLGKQLPITIWWDTQLDPNQLFDNVIEDRINRSALFLALTSNSYLQSDYCRKELKHFHSKAAAEPSGLAPGDRSRIFNLLLYNIPYLEWPEEYSGTTDYTFHTPETETDLSFPLKPSGAVFDKQLRLLIKGISKTFDAFDDPATPSTPGPFRVFMAETTDPLRVQRDDVVEKLKERGIDVSEELPPPFEAQPHEERVIAALKEAKVSVHLLDGLTGRKIVGAPKPIYYSQRQAELGIQYAESQIIWIPNGLDIESVADSSYKDLLAKLKKGIPAKSAYYFIQDNPDKVAQNILDVIKKIEETSQAATLAPGVLIDAHEKDRQYALTLEQYLKQKNVKCYINWQGDDPQQNIISFVDGLKKASILITIFGSVAPEWVIERLKTALQIIISRNLGVTAYGIYLAPPPKAPTSINFNPGFVRIQMLDNSEEFKADTMDSLLADIEAKKNKE